MIPSVILTVGWNTTAYYPKDLRKLAAESLPPNLLTLTASQVIDQIKASLPDVGLSSLERGASKEVKRDDLDSNGLASRIN